MKTKTQTKTCIVCRGEFGAYLKARKGYRGTKARRSDVKTCSKECAKLNARGARRKDVFCD